MGHECKLGRFATFFNERIYFRGYKSTTKTIVLGGELRGNWFEIDLFLFFWSDRFCLGVEVYSEGLLGGQHQAIFNSNVEFINEVCVACLAGNGFWKQTN